LTQYSKFLNLKSLLFLGDDDLTSVACALTKNFDKIVVVDIFFNQHP